MGLGSFIREQSLAEGFGAVGFARAGAVPGDILARWLDLGCHGEMSYMARSPDRRLDPRLVLKGAGTVVSMIYPYPHSPMVTSREKGKGIVARYALGKDYHLVLEKKLRRILGKIRDAYPQVNGRAYVDYGPVCETYWARQAGLGWIGKNSLLLSRKFGSWFFLAEILQRRTGLFSFGKQRATAAITETSEKPAAKTVRHGKKRHATKKEKPQNGAVTTQAAPENEPPEKQGEHTLDAMRKARDRARRRTK